MDAVFTAHSDASGLLADIRQPGPRTPPSGPCRRSRLRRPSSLISSNVTLRRLRSSGGTSTWLLRRRPIQDEDEHRPHGARAAHQPAQSRRRWTSWQDADAALVDLDEVQRMDLVDLSTGFLKARILMRAGRGPEAVAVYDAAVDQRRNATSLNNRCWMRALTNIELTGAEADRAEAGQAGTQAGRLLGQLRPGRPARGPAGRRSYLLWPGPDPELEGGRLALRARAWPSSARATRQVATRTSPPPGRCRPRSATSWRRPGSRRWPSPSAPSLPPPAPPPGPGPAPGRLPRR